MGTPHSCLEPPNPMEQQGLGVANSFLGLSWVTGAVGAMDWLPGRVTSAKGLGRGDKGTGRGETHSQPKLGGRGDTQSSLSRVQTHSRSRCILMSREDSTGDSAPHGDSMRTVWKPRQTKWLQSHWAISKCSQEGQSHIGAHPAGGRGSERPWGLPARDRTAAEGVNG